MNKMMFPTPDDFMKASERGIDLAVRQDNPLPDEKDREDLKALYAMFITATIEMDGNKSSPDEIDKKLASVRLALLAAYNLGRERGKSYVN